MHASLRSLALLLALTPLALHAQQAAPAGSTISGKVTCSDTNAPARFAKVLFKPVEPGNGNPFLNNLQKTMQDMQAAQAKSGALPPPSPDDAAEQKRRLAAASRGMSQVTDMLSASTSGLNGDYALTGLKPGSYYVHASLPGYIDPLSQFTDDELASTDPAVRARIAAAVPVITVSGTEAIRLDLRLERGASVSGKVLYDDGAPAAGWTVTAIHPGSDSEDDAAEAAMAPALAMTGQATTIARTDDLGSFRIAGLPPGVYTLRAGLVAMPTGVSMGNAREAGSGINLTVYSGDTFRRSAAKTFTLIAGDTRTGVDITVPQHKLHNISGHVTAKADAHALNGGSILLTTKDDPSIHLTAAIRDDGSFAFNDLPSGSYTLKAAGAADTRTTGSSKLMGIAIPRTETLHMYAPGSADVTLADLDLTGVDFSLAQLDWKPPAHGADDAGDPAAALGKVFGAMLSGDDSDDSKPTDGSAKPAAAQPAPPAQQ